MDQKSKDLVDLAIGITSVYDWDQFRLIADALRDLHRDLGTLADMIGVLHAGSYDDAWLKSARTYVYGCVDGLILSDWVLRSVVMNGPMTIPVELLFVPELTSGSMTTEKAGISVWVFGCNNRHFVVQLRGFNFATTEMPLEEAFRVLPEEYHVPIVTKLLVAWLESMVVDMKLAEDYEISRNIMARQAFLYMAVKIVELERDLIALNANERDDFMECVMDLARNIPWQSDHEKYAILSFIDKELDDLEEQNDLNDETGVDGTDVLAQTLWLHSLAEALIAEWRSNVQSETRIA